MRKALGLALCFGLGATFAACSHDITGPSVAATRAEPDLVCNAKPVSKPFSTVTIHGTNMTPMPSKTLEGTKELILPKVTLNMITSLDAAGVSQPLTIADDPAKPADSRVKWTSESEMSFDLRPEDKIPPGVMTVQITNPDGKSTVTIEKGLAVVPAPTIATLKPPAICDDQSDQTVLITGTNLLSYDDAGGKSHTPTVTVGTGATAKTYTATFDPKDCKIVEGNFAEKNIQLCTQITIKILKGDFPVTAPTKVPVVVTNPAPADCQTSETIELTIEPPPKVDAVVPSTVCEGGSQLTITGSGFITGAKVTLDCAGTRVDAGSVTVDPAGTKITATFGGGATPGTSCDVIVTNPDGCEDRPLPHKKVTVTTGPIVFYVDPPVVYNGINTRATIFVTTITPPVPAADGVVIVPNGKTTPVTALEFGTVTGFPNRLQATVKSGQAAGSYDLTVKDSSGCFATLPNAIKVVDTLNVTMKNVNPPFGYTGEDTSITVFRDTAAAAPADKPFIDSPRLFLNPVGGTAADLAVPITGVSFFDKDTVTGLVPKGTPVKKYDLVLVNPDGTVGLLKAAYDELTNAPPVITSATPSSIAASSGQVVVLAGRNFDATDKVTLRCVNSAGTAIASPTVTSVAPVCAAGACTQSITIDGSSLTAGDVCVVRVTNADGSYGEYSAIGVTTPSLNLNSPKAGTTMNVGRRALTSAAGDATVSARFVYAIGGDAGTAAGALDSYEFAPVDLFGKMGAWTTSPIKLKNKRTLAGATLVGRYIYNVGGNDGTGPVATAERALILSPRETPEITDLDLKLDAAGLEAGNYHYRVSATFDATDTDNPGGESLASDEFSLRVPAFPGKKVKVTLVYRAPLDSLGAPVAGVSGYKIYRTAKDGASGSEVLLATVTGASTITFEDDGSKTLGTAKPLPVGTTGEWLQLPAMATKREALGVAAAFDPATPTTFYVYGLMGKPTATTATGTYEYLTVTVAPNGRQTAGTWKAGTATNAAPRSEFGAWVATRFTSSLITGSATWIYLGGGKNAGGTLDGAVDAGKVAAGGDLGTFDTGPKDFSSTSSGYGICSANEQLFVFGGAGGAPSSGAKSAKITTPVPTLISSSWNSEGLTMTHGRYLMGSSVQSAFIFLLGGQTDEPSTASKTTELVIW